MASLTADEYHQALQSFDRESRHLELRDAYGTETELPHLAKWRAGEPDDLAWLRPYCDRVRADVAAGKTYRRAHVVSEPLSDYHRWTRSIVAPMVEAGDEIRWVPRRLVSSIAFPGNDFYLLDDRVVIFLHYAGNGRSVGYTTSTDPSDLELCRTAFEAVWPLGVPHHRYASVCRERRISGRGITGPTRSGDYVLTLVDGRAWDGRRRRATSRTPTAEESACVSH